MKQYSNFPLLSILILGTTLGCSAKEVVAEKPGSFDGRWEAKLASTATKRSGENKLLIDCQHLTGKVMHFVIKNGKGNVFVGGPTTAKGTTNAYGIFRFRTTRKTSTVTVKQEFINVEKDFVLHGSLADLNAKYTIDYKNFGAGCDVDATLRKVADSLGY